MPTDHYEIEFTHPLLKIRAHESKSRGFFETFALCIRAKYRL